MARLAGKVALITGAGSGIGEQTARLFASEGASVIVADLQQAAADRVAQSIRDGGGEAIGVAADIADEMAIKAMVEQALAAYGRIDILHNNAAITDGAFMARDQDLINMDAAIWDRSFAVNVRGPMLVSKHVLPGMIKQRRGSVIFTGSGKGIQGDLDRTAYGAGKAALINISRSIAAQYGKHGVRSNVIVVGLVMSEALRANMPAPLQQMMEGHHLTPYLGTPEHVANAALFLASDEAAFVTGHELYADGGVTSHSPFLVDFRRMREAAAKTA